MAETNSIKAAVRARDGSRCVECGMTEQEHRENFGRDLHVHRLEEGADYARTECVTLCELCHFAVHQPDHLRWQVWKRDGYRCTRCGKSAVELRKDGKARLQIHCAKKVDFPKHWKQSPWICKVEEYWDWRTARRRQGITAQDCVTVCQQCHCALHASHWTASPLSAPKRKRS